MGKRRTRNSAATSKPLSGLQGDSSNSPPTPKVRRNEPGLAYLSEDDEDLLISDGFKIKDYTREHQMRINETEELSRVKLNPLYFQIYTHSTKLDEHFERMTWLIFENKKPTNTTAIIDCLLVIVGELKNHFYEYHGKQDKQDKETNTKIIWTLPPNKADKKTQTEKEEKIQTPAQNKTGKIQTPAHKASETKSTTDSSEEEDGEKNEVAIAELNNMQVAPLLSPLPATPPCATTTTPPLADKHKRQTTQQKDKTTRRRPPPYVRKQQNQQQPKPQPQHQQHDHRQRQHWRRQRKQQQRMQWGYFNHPIADMIQLLLNHLYWPPAPWYTYPNGHRGQHGRQRHQQLQQQHK